MKTMSETLEKRCSNATERWMLLSRLSEPARKEAAGAQAGAQVYGLGVDIGLPVPAALEHFRALERFGVVRVIGDGMAVRVQVLHFVEPAVPSGMQPLAAMLYKADGKTRMEWLLWVENPESALPDHVTVAGVRYDNTFNTLADATPIQMPVYRQPG